MSESTGARPYPQIMHQIDVILGFIAVLSVMTGTTLLIVLLWEDAESKWAWQSVANLGVLITVCVFSLTTNRLLSRSHAVPVRIAHACISLCILAALIVSTLVIWQVTDTEVGWQTIGTTFILVIGSLLSIAVSRMVSR